MVMAKKPKKHAKHGTGGGYYFEEIENEHPVGKKAKGRWTKVLMTGY